MERDMASATVTQNAKSALALQGPKLLKKGRTHTQYKTSPSSNAWIVVRSTRPNNPNHDNMATRVPNCCTLCASATLLDPVRRRVEVSGIMISIAADTPFRMPSSPKMVSRMRSLLSLGRVQFPNSPIKDRA